MDNDIKIANIREIKSQPPKGFFNVRIVKYNDIVGKIPSTPYVLKTSNDGTNYLAELHLVNHEYGIKEKVCFLYDEFTKEDKRKYQDAVTTILAKYSDIQYYQRPKSKKKK